jgi:dienelactone hydrolase
MRNALVLALSALVIFLAGSAWLALYPGIPPDLGGVADLDANARHVRIPVGEGDTVDAWVLAGTRPGVIVLFHGYARDHHREWRYARFLNRDGWTIVAPDFRSARARGRKPTTLGGWELRDATAVLDWVAARPEWRGTRIGVFGESLGGSVGIVAAAGRRDVAAVVLDSPFLDGRAAIEDALRYEEHVPPAVFAPVVRLLGRLATGHDPAALDAGAGLRAWAPLLLGQAGVEDRFGRAQAAAIAREAGPAAEDWLVADAGHTQAWQRHPREYEARVGAFFLRHLGAAAGASRPAAVVPR